MTKNLFLLHIFPSIFLCLQRKKSEAIKIELVGHQELIINKELINVYLSNGKC